MTAPAMLPSRLTASRELRVRVIRRVLQEHCAFENEEHTRITGCDCGWTTPAYLVDGQAAFNDHLAQVIATAA